jgi:choline dehydrogenase-like flavoprotein
VRDPMILNTPEEIDPTLTLDVAADQRIQITSGHPMGGCALGGDPRRDVVDSIGRRYIAGKIVEEIVR